MSAVGKTRTRDAGLSLIEVLVSLAIFSFIATAGYTMLVQTLRIKEVGEVRLERLSEIERTVFLFRTDLLGAINALPMDLNQSSETADGTLFIDRPGAPPLRYYLLDGTLIREVTRAPQSQSQPILDGLQSVRFRFLPETAPDWTDRIKASDHVRAVELRLELTDPAAEIRYVAELADGMPQHAQTGVLPRDEDEADDVAP